MPIDWDAIRQALPIQKNAEDWEKRNKIWSGIDMNGNGYVSLAELDKGLQDIMYNVDLFDCKPAIIRAHQAAKNKVKTKKLHGPDYVERSEFRLCLVYLRQYFEYYEAFNRVDTNDDRRINMDEFMGAQEIMERWVGPIENMKAAFDDIDTNNGGMILFREFVRWATRKSLDLEDDDDYDTLA